MLQYVYVLILLVYLTVLTLHIQIRSDSGARPELPLAKATEELPADLPPPKTERWRESGQRRWPPVAEGQLPAASVEVC